MERSEFERLRDLPERKIRADVRFRSFKSTSPLRRAEDLRIENSAGVEALLDITFHPVRGSKTFNVTVVGVGPICRLDVDGPPHPPAGYSHKHSLQTERCPDRNLPASVTDRPDLNGKSMRELFDIFCSMANITFEGAFEDPEIGANDGHG